MPALSNDFKDEMKAYLRLANVNNLLDVVGKSSLVMALFVGYLVAAAQNTEEVLAAVGPIGRFICVELSAIAVVAATAAQFLSAVIQYEFAHIKSNPVGPIDSDKIAENIYRETLAGYRFLQDMRQIIMALRYISYSALLTFVVSFSIGTYARHAKDNGGNHLAIQAFAVVAGSLVLLTLYAFVYILNTSQKRLALARQKQVLTSTATEGFSMI